MDEHKILRPTPRRTGTAAFILTPSTSTLDMSSAVQSSMDNHHNRSSTPSSEIQNRSNGPFQKSRSILNLTSSTLFGIYSPSSEEPYRDHNLNTPWGNGAQTPIRKRSIDERTTQPVPQKVQEKTGPIQVSEKLAIEKHGRVRSVSGAKRPVNTIRYVTGLLFRNMVLFLMGLAYGGIITQLRSTEAITPVRVDNVDRSSWFYLGFWGFSGVILGNLLPWVDLTLSKKEDSLNIGTSTREPNSKRAPGFGVDRAPERRPKPTLAQARNSLGADWNPVVRSIGAFVGIAFAIRRLPWQSTLQVSLTLALANPVIWYLLDRSRTGFYLSLAFSVAGASALLSTNPGIVPTPRMQARAEGELGNSTAKLRNAPCGSLGVSGGISDTGGYETIAVATWIASVLFCSCVCFGNVGRRLVPGGVGSWRST